MVKFIGNILDDIPEDINGESSTPPAHHFFDVAEDATNLSRTDADLFRRFFAQLLYL